MISRTPDLRTPKVRLRIVYAALMAGFCLLTLRAAQLAIAGERGLRRGESQLLTALPLPPERGRIVDREGVELALTVGVPSVYAVPSEVRDPEETARQLAALLGIDAAPIAERLRQKRAFVYVQRWVADEAAKRIESLGLPGVGILSEPKRAYPHGAFAASLLGFANIDGRGARGIEQQEDAWLYGKPQRLAVERDARGRLLLGPGLDPTASVGGDVALSLDVALQADAERGLAEGVAAAKARGGVVVTIDPRSGEVLALAESPSFDPNHFRSIPYAETRARAFTDVVEPGSTFKTFVIAAALEAGAVRPEDLFDLRGGIYVPGKHIRDLHPKPQLDVTGILRVSSNVGSVKIAHRVGPRFHEEVLRRFGFGARTGSGFPDESGGILRSSRNWRPVDAATIAFGQGVSVTALQLAAGMAAFGNDGVWMPPRLVRARRAPGSAWEAIPPGEPRQAVSAQTAAQVMAMLESVVHVEGGTARRARVRGLPVAGKTGTAQKLEPNGRYSQRRYLAWFVGLVPADAPRLAIAVGIDEPGTVAHTGGAVAAPVFARIAAAQLTRLGLPTEPEELPATTVAGSAAPPPPAAVEKVVVPDLHGLTLAEVVRRAGAVGLRVDLAGSGRAARQVPAPGTAVVASRQRVRVELERAPRTTLAQARSAR